MTIGRNVLLVAQVGIAGSTVIEDGVTLAGQVGVAGHLTIGKGTVASAQTGIPNSVPAGSFVSGYPAIPNRDWLKSSAVFRKLPSSGKPSPNWNRGSPTWKPGCAPDHAVAGVPSWPSRHPAHLNGPYN